MLKGHFAFRLPWRKYLNIQITDKYDLPVDWWSIAYQMVYGNRAADAEFLGRALMKERATRLIDHIDAMKTIRILERKIAAQRIELRRITAKG